VVLVACGGSQPARSPTPTVGVAAAPTAPAATPAPGAPPSVTEICDRVQGPLARCTFAKQLGDDRDSCIANMSDPAMAPVVKHSGACFVQHDDCDDVIACVMDTSIDKHDLRACSPTDARAVGMPKAAWDRRKGATVTRYADANSSKQEPLEICGLPDENAWLFQATCNDGSHPIQTRAQAEHMRAGNIGLAGRCQSIVDRYLVRCPETTYEIFMDAYVCPLP